MGRRGGEVSAVLHVGGTFREGEAVLDTLVGPLALTIMMFYSTAFPPP